MKRTKYIVLTLLIVVSQLAIAKSVVKEFKVKGQCGECKERIETALDLPGISFATWDVESKVLTVRYNDKRFSEDQIHTIISDLGYATAKVDANKEAENKLPNCCKPGGASHCGDK
ncbi:MAG: mercuric ion binding protein [Bacteroidia bacterium]|jgi:mercuric ion binding protein